MEEEGMKITIVGAVLVAITVIGAILLIHYLRKKGDHGPEQNQS